MLLQRGPSPASWVDRFPCYEHTVAFSSPPHPFLNHHLDKAGIFTRSKLNPGINQACRMERPGMARLRGPWRAPVPRTPLQWRQTGQNGGRLELCVVAVSWDLPRESCWGGDPQRDYHPPQSITFLPARVDTMDTRLWNNLCYTWWLLITGILPFSALSHQAILVH